MAQTVNNAKIYTNFTTAATREQLTSGENLCTSLGKANKYFADLDAGVFSMRGNILRNSNFAINQRGQTSYTVNGYTVDCWKMGALGADICRVTPVDTGVKLGFSSTSITTKEVDITQYIEEAACYAGKTFVASTYVAFLSANKATLKVSSLVDGTWGASSLQLSVGFNSLLVTIPENATKICVSLCATSGSGTALYAQFSWVKLEEGSIATPYIAPDPATELARCQRYLQTINAYAPLRAAGLTTSIIDFCVPLSVTMASIPSIVDSSTMQVCNLDYSVETDFTFATTVMSSGSVNIRATKTAHGLSDAIFRSTGNILLSAEL